MTIARYLIKTGQFAGQVVDGVGCNAREFPDSEPDSSKYRDAIFIPSLGLRLTAEREDSYEHCGHHVHYENLVVAFDKYDNEIFVGDEIYAAVGKEVCRLKVVAMTGLNHVGCGWMQRKMRCKNEETGKTLTVNIPHYVIKIV